MHVLSYARYIRCIRDLTLASRPPLLEWARLYRNPQVRAAPLRAHVCSPPLPRLLLKSSVPAAMAPRAVYRAGMRAARVFDARLQVRAPERVLQCKYITALGGCSWRLQLESERAHEAPYKRVLPYRCNDVRR
eukprot:IDg16047t1